jgi:hypothetical protein
MHSIASSSDAILVDKQFVLHIYRVEASNSAQQLQGGGKELLLY